MGRKLYVGNLSYDVTDSALEQMFAQHGTVVAGDTNGKGRRPACPGAPPVPLRRPVVAP